MPNKAICNGCYGNVNHDWCKLFFLVSIDTRVCCHVNQELSKLYCFIIKNVRVIVILYLSSGSNIIYIYIYISVIIVNITSIYGIS